MKRNLSQSLLLNASILLVLLAPLAAVAQPPNQGGGPPEFAGPPQDVVDSLLAKGFRKVEPAVFQRTNEDTSVDTVAFDAEGHEFLVRVLEAKVQTLQERQDANFQAEREEAILIYQQWIADFEAYITEATKQRTPAARQPAGDPDGLTSLSAALTACDSTLHRLADAKPGTDGPTAHGESSFTDSCSAYGEAQVLTTASGWDSTHTTETTMTQNCYQPGNGAASCNATAHVAAVLDCQANADGIVKLTADQGDFGFPSLVTWLVSDANSLSCRVPTATLTGSSSVYVPYGTCRSGSWSVSASGGTGFYSYQWYYDGVAVGSNSTGYSRTYCNYSGSGATFYDTVSVKVTDTRGDSVQKSKSVTVSFEAVCSDPCLCPLDPTQIQFGEPGVHQTTAEQIIPCV